MRTQRLFAGFLTLLLLASCDGGSDLVVAAYAPGDIRSTPATPPPKAVPTPASNQNPPVSAPTPTALPTPVPPSPTTQATVAPSPDPTPTPVPSAGSPYRKTGVATDLAISGPAYFVLATKPNPAGASDLLFTRNGHFTFTHETAGTLSLWRMRHASSNFHVVGFLITAGTAAGAPDETQQADGVELATSWGGQITAALGLFVDADRNADAPASIGFDFTGRLLVDQGSPRGSDGNAEQIYLALATFEHPEGLVAQPGFDGVLKYAPAAGAVNLGVPVSGDSRPVGNANLILTGQLESPAP